MENKSKSSSNFTLALGSFSGEQPKDEDVSSFSRRLDSIFGGLETHVSEPSLNDTLAKPVNPNLGEDSQVPRKERKACFSCGSTAHVSRACPHAPRSSGSANNPTHQGVPSRLRDSSKYTHYTIDRDYDANEEKQSALNFITELQRKKAAEVAVAPTEGFTPIFAPKNERSSKRLNFKTSFSTNLHKSTKSETKDTKEQKEENSSKNHRTQPVSLSHLGDEDEKNVDEVADDVKTSESLHVIKEDEIRGSLAFKKKKKGKQKFRKHVQQVSEGATT